MGLRLFHITEFAQSSMFTPAVQRESRHPFSLMLWISLWLATACNLPLWQRLWQIPELGLGGFLWSATLLTLMMVLGLCAILSLFNWQHGLLRMLLTLLLLASALNTHLLLQAGRFVDMAMLRDPLQALRPFLGWPMLLPMFVLAILPSFWVWSTPLRRIRMSRRLSQNFYFLLAVLTLLGGLWLLSLSQLQPLLRTHPQLGHLITPGNTLLSVAKALGGERWRLP
ncbi:MAG: DUF1705 domain-containing protein [Hylemonella sp.]|nr:DUF1705 domain-containing protein [Hylemonella sp.]